MMYYTANIRHFLSRSFKNHQIPLIILFFGMLTIILSVFSLYQTTALKSLAAQANFTMGTVTIGASTDTGDGNSITCNRYGASASGTISTMSVAVGNVDSTSNKYSLAIYTDTSGSPSTLLAASTGTLIANSWNTLSLSSQITAGNYYWLCYNGSTNNSSYDNMKYTSGSIPAIYKDQLYGTWPATFGTIGAKWTDAYSIYATVNVGGIPTPTSIPTLTNIPTPTNAPMPTSITPTAIINPTATPTPTPAPTAMATPTQTIGSVVPMSLISRSVPAFASSGTAAQANDADYKTTWRSNSSSSWLTYNLSGVPVAKRGQVLLVWYNEATEAYDPSLASESLIRIPRNYTIQTNSAPSNPSAPTSGWVTKVTVSANKYHSRQHVFDMTGANWVRINITAISGGSNADLNMDMYDASSGITDDWIIYGSSTPAMSLGHNDLGTTKQTFSQIINQAKPAYFPVFENGAISGLDSVDGVNNINTWLPLFPGKYVGIALGANDADECMDPNTFYNNFVTMIQAVTNAGKVPVIPIFNWSKLATVQRCGPALVNKINQLYTNYPQVIKGPDFWTFFKAHPELVSSDNQHPTTEGAGQYRQLWAQSALANVYK